MPGCCSIRALWILSAQDAVVFSRRFPVVEKRWRSACEGENEKSSGYALRPLLPTDSELAAAFAARKEREGSVRGFGIRVSQSTQGSDSWVDDPITRHIISLSIISEGGEEFLLWPLVLHTKGYFYIILLPLVEPYHLKSYERMASRLDCGNPVGGAESMSSLLLDLPCITGSLMVAHAIGDIVTGDLVDPEVVASSSPSVGGLLDSLTGSIGIPAISTRAKPVATSVTSSTTSGAAVTGSVSSDAPKSTSRPIDKDAMRTFVSASMPFGTPLDLNFSSISAIKINGFSSLDLPLPDLKQPAWKPYLYKGKQRILFTIQETVSAALYDRDDIPDSVMVSGQLNCRAELEGLPDVSCPLIGANTANIEALSFHPCAQIPEHGADKQSVMFTPPLGNFVLMRYQALAGLNPPVKGFYQLSMVSEDEGAFLFKLRLMEGYKSPLTMDFCTVTMPFPMEGYKSPLTMDFCTVTMPFPRRRVIFFDGNPSIGTVSTTDHSVEWKIVTSGRGITGKSIEATFPGTIRFSPVPSQRMPFQFRPKQGIFSEEDSDVEPETSSVVNVEDYLIAKMNKNLLPVDLEEPFCWQAYNYAKVSFKVLGATLSGISIDPKSVSIYPSVKASVEFSMQASSGDYILWNTLGKCPSVASPKV